jgi:NADH:ubiquinone oxidoreductase subunit F (NADH-binding)/(2Fe-2S) ferredoxin/NAD-dependent dihydropyrimidine dehydrogenase PreA subunit
MGQYRVNLMVCAGTACVANHSFEIKQALEREIALRGLETEVQVVATGCNGFCAQGPLMVVQPDGIFYCRITPKDVPLLVEEHFLKGRPLQKLMFTPPEAAAPVPKMNDMDFFNYQRLIALRNRGLIDPEKIDDYIGREGYTALAKVLTSMTPEQVIKEIKESGLRGRGGGGFHTGEKWARARASTGDIKYVVCNADEGDPGAFMDRSIIESDPHVVLEGMLIGAYAIGAQKGIIYIRQEYPLARERLQVAIDQARDYGLLGVRVFDTDFSFDVEIALGAGAFVCGEETALIASVEGRLGEPRPRPPYPAVKGLWGKPTNINNVETWANVPIIINRGAKWFSSIGTETSKGTKVFSLVGKINNTGLVEVPMGITLYDIIYRIGGGIPGGKKFKAVQTGGPSGGCIPASMLPLAIEDLRLRPPAHSRLPSDLLSLSIDYESLAEAGSMMGSGGMVVMDEDNCMVDVARYFLAFTKDESCGKCTPCREGNTRMYEILTKITEGKGAMEDLELLERLAQVIKSTSLCGLGRTASNPVLTTLWYFRDEYLAHIQQRKCPARICRQLNVYTIDPDLCVTKGHGCGVCRRECPGKAIAGEKNKAHVIDQNLCDKCGVCFEVCKFNAVHIA